MGWCWQVACARQRADRGRLWVGRGDAVGNECAGSRPVHQHLERSPRDERQHAAAAADQHDMEDRRRGDGDLAAAAESWRRRKKSLRRVWPCCALTLCLCLPAVLLPTVPGLKPLRGLLSDAPLGLCRRQVRAAAARRQPNPHHTTARQHGYTTTGQHMVASADPRDGPGAEMPARAARQRLDATRMHAAGEEVV